MPYVPFGMYRIIRFVLYEPYDMIRSFLPEYCSSIFWKIFENNQKSQIMEITKTTKFISSCILGFGLVKNCEKYPNNEPAKGW